MQEFQIGAVAGVVVSLLFKYVPGLNTWFEGLNPQNKELFMLGALIVVVGGAFGLSCAGWENIYACDQLGAKEAVYALVGAVIGNQGAYSALSHQRQ
jgi:multisubunit Na+/H+ antiporter MnhB subunit